MRNSEAQYRVSVTPDDEIVCQHSDGGGARIPMKDVRAIYVETNDSGPVGMDVWWLLEGPSGEIELAFPQMATGEAEALDRFAALPGFEIKGMNSTSNARFECWRRIT